MAKRKNRATKIMIMRHAEKPAKDGLPQGVTLEGERNKESLEPRGWQRAGALTNLFAPANGKIQIVALAKPQFLYASKPLQRKGSRRPFQTIFPLAEKLALPVNLNYERSDVEAVADEAMSRRGVVLMCWQREYIPEIAAYILEDDKRVPDTWPEDRFDMIWVFDLDRRSGKYKFKQVPQRLLSRDSTTPIR
jgi:broad specificity phosphatase PhoE